VPGHNSNHIHQYDCWPHIRITGESLHSIKRLEKLQEMVFTGDQSNMISQGRAATPDNWQAIFIIPGKDAELVIFPP
jgi:hypothetical protein